MIKNYFVDIHIHPDDILPSPLMKIYRAVYQRKAPNILEFRNIGQARLSLAFVNVVGDPLVTRFYSLNPLKAVKKQIKKVLEKIVECNYILYKNPESIQEGIEQQKPVILLSIEGGDFLSNNLKNLTDVYSNGVRALGLVHYSDNCIGLKSSSLFDIEKGTDEKNKEKKENKRDEEGLTIFGQEVIAEMNDLQMVIDLAHSHKSTLLSAVKFSRAPVIVSHSGAKTLCSFSRFLSDEEIENVGKKGGLIGLWPFYYKEKGIRTTKELAKHINYIHSISSASLAIGTDINAIPQAMEDFKQEQDLLLIAEELKKHLKHSDIENIMGKNCIAFLKSL